jgi:hypothetical protein
MTRMKTNAPLLTILWLTLAVAPALAEPPERENVEAELKRITNALLDAIAPGDWTIWKRFADDRLIYVSEALSSERSGRPAVTMKAELRDGFFQPGQPKGSTSAG